MTPLTMKRTNARCTCWGRSHRLRDLAERAQVVAPDPQPKRADVGCVITIDLAGQTQQWLLAGWDDGDPKIGRLAYNSPLGMALWGAELGEVRECRVSGQVKEVEIVAIAPAVVEAT